ncbi:peptide ABC transporter ATP-binding protein [Marinomonas sp. SBI22]|uniref:DMT family transporter n=1 Tax=unclassified Marinomonas TaxID=196814 RepID=UPI0007AFADAF|nr:MULTISPECIES: DMT family transporter [unclassified Marinomonas]KZM44299.1 peptide ABC transporter ATP-binding protein [Marinomonas sp. SBI22]KZM45457.1 peptide ABC transporter ATP-binding protein [Marinomonas sp. SBI8L]
MFSRLITLAPFFFVFLWSTGFIGAKYALVYIEPFTLLMVRMFITLVLLGTMCWYWVKKWPTKNEIGHQMVAGLLIHGVYLSGVFAAIKAGLPAGITAIIVGGQPILTVVLSWYLYKARLTLRQSFGFGFGLIGVIATVLFTQGVADFSFSFTAVLYALLALLAITLGSLYQKHFGAKVELLAANFWQYASSLVLVTILSFTFETQEIEWSLTLILSLTWLILVLSFMATFLLLYLIREGEASQVASYFYLVPPTASLNAWVLFDERLVPAALFAMGLTVLGVYLVTSKGRSK